MTHPANQPPSREPSVFDVMATDPVVSYYATLAFPEEPPVDERYFLIDSLEKDRVSRFDNEEMKAYLAEKYATTVTDAQHAIITCIIGISRKMEAEGTWDDGNNS